MGETMFWRGLTVAFAGLGVLGSPLAALHCDDDPAAATCCRPDATDCNQPGKNDDCCHTLPTNDQTLTLAVKAGALAEPRCCAAPADARPAAALAVGRAGAFSAAARGSVPQSLPPPPLSVLRI